MRNAKHKSTCDLPSFVYKEHSIRKYMCICSFVPRKLKKSKPKTKKIKKRVVGMRRGDISLSVFIFV